jgi:hypothetical protein
MSKITLAANASGSGTYTIAAPNSNNSRTMGLPDSAGDLVVTQATQTLTNKTFSGAQVFGTASLAEPTGGAPLYMARAWVNFNGTGTVAIRASGNVTSITDNGTGDYTVNFTTAMPDANYSMVNASAQNTSIGPIPVGFQSATAPTASAARVECGAFSNNSRLDSAYLTLAFFR